MAPVLGSSQSACPADEHSLLFSRSSCPTNGVHFSPGHGGIPPYHLRRSRKLDTPPPPAKSTRMAPTLQTPPPMPEIRRIVREVCARHPVARADLFGSVARGAVCPGSDVDVLVEFVPGTEVGLLEMGALREELAEALGCPVDVVSRRAVERSTNPFRRRAMLAKTVNVYAR